MARATDRGQYRSRVTATSEYFGPPPSMTSKCPECGRSVVLPCRACEVAARKRRVDRERRQAGWRPPDPAGVMEVDLVGVDRLRYLEIRLHRCADADGPIPMPLRQIEQLRMNG
jgi:hypothetical protein